MPSLLCTGVFGVVYEGYLSNAEDDVEGAMPVIIKTVKGEYLGEREREKGRGRGREREKRKAGERDMGVEYQLDKEITIIACLYTQTTLLRLW